MQLNGGMMLWACTHRRIMLNPRKPLQAVHCHCSPAAARCVFEFNPGPLKPSLRRGGLLPRLVIRLLGVWLATAAMGQTANGNPPQPEPARSGIASPLNTDWKVGPWIWGPETYDKQTCRLWRSFEIPEGGEVKEALLRISVDNGYRLILDGREIGTGSDWRSITEYDISQLLRSGHHVVAVEGFNDNREAGLQFGLKIELVDGRVVEVLSDTEWRVAPRRDSDWAEQVEAPAHWVAAVEVSALLPRSGNWQKRIPTMVLRVVVPPAVEQRFWQSGWFQALLWSVVAFAVLLSLRLTTRLTTQSKAQELLRRERARIARDIHDELGARLTELALEGEVIQTELPVGSSVGSKLEALCEKARAVSGAMDEVVWVVNSRRDTLHDFTTYTCKYTQRFLEASSIRCRLDVDADLPQLQFSLPVRRSLLLGVKEALNNAAKYSEATELFLRIHRQGQILSVIIADNGIGFDLELADPERNGLTNMKQRMKEFGGRCRITTSPGSGCQVEFQVPLPKEIHLPAESSVQDGLPLISFFSVTNAIESEGKDH